VSSLGTKRSPSGTKKASGTAGPSYVPVP
jgi:hypothetical protein